MITNGAMFMAHILHDAYQDAEEQETGFPVGDWYSLSDTDRHCLGMAIQKLFDIGVLHPFTLSQVKIMRMEGVLPFRPAREP